MLIGLVGAGTMGASIAQGAATSGFTVILNDRDPAVVLVSQDVVQQRGLARAQEARDHLKGHMMTSSHA